MADDNAIATFVNITGCNDPNTARQYLEMANDNLENAIALYMDSGGMGSGSGEAPDFIPPDVLAEAQGINSPEVRAPMQFAEDQIVGGGNKQTEKQRKDAIEKDFRGSEQRMTFAAEPPSAGAGGKKRCRRGC